MPRLFQKRSGTWSEILSVFQKQNGTWVEILNIFQKIGGTWTKVFSAAKIPGNTVAPTITGTGRLFSTLTNNSLGTWTNSPTSYTRQWRRGNPSSGGGLPSGYSNISGATSSTYTTTSLDDGKYIVCQVTATNAVGSNSASSNAIYINKYSPVVTGNYTLSGSAIVGGTLTALESISPATWKQTTDISGDTYPDSFEYEWSYEDGTIRQSTSHNNINSSSYTILAADLGKKIRLRVNGINTGGSMYTPYVTSSTVTSSYQFSFGNTLYVGTNAFIGLDSSSYTALSLPTGRTVAIHPKDMVQYYLAEYSDSSDYWLYYKSYLYNQPQTAANALDYQIRFYTDTNKKYCDVYFVRKGSNVVLPTFDTGFWNSGTFSGIFPSPPAITTGTVLRVYFDGQSATYGGIPWTAIDNGIWKVISTTSLDDDSTTVVTGPNRQSSLITPTSLSATTNDSAKITLTWSGGSADTYMLYWLTSSSLYPAQTFTGSDFEDNASPYEWTGMGRGTTYYFFIRSRNGTSPDFTYSSNWFPAQTTGIVGRAPKYAPPTPTITNSAQSSSSLSWHWDQPTPTTSQDEPTSWEYAITQNTSTPSSGTSLTTRPTSSTPLVTSSLSADTTYYLHVRAKNEDANGSWTYQSGKTSVATVLYTVTFNANGATGSPSVSSVTQSTQGGSVTLASIGTMSLSGNIFGGWRTATNGGTVYAFGATFTPTSNITLYAYYGPTPTCAAPSWTQAGNFTRTNTQSEIIWYTDFPTPSGAYSAIQSMQFQISTTQSTTGLLIGGDPIATRSYPGSGTYPYSGGGTIWAFKCGRDRSSVGQVSDIAFSTSARYARVRVRMTGIDGLTYNGTYSGWI